MSFFKKHIRSLSKTKRILYSLALAFVFLTGLLFLLKKEDKNQILELNTSVTFDGTRFQVTNKDTFDYVHADISIDSYFKIRNHNLKAGESYTLWKVEFLHHNGMRFPQKVKPHQFSIWCTVKEGVNGYYSKKIK